MIKNTFQNIMKMSKSNVKNRTFLLISSKYTNYPSYVVHNKQYEEKGNFTYSDRFKRNHIKKKIIYDRENWFAEQLSSGENYDFTYSDGFKRNHIDNEKKITYDRENWFADQLSSGENYI